MSLSAYGRAALFPNLVIHPKRQKSNSNRSTPSGGKSITKMTRRRPNTDAAARAPQTHLGTRRRHVGGPDTTTQRGPFRPSQLEITIPTPVAHSLKQGPPMEHQFVELSQITMPQGLQKSQASNGSSSAGQLYTHHQEEPLLVYHQQHPQQQHQPHIQTYESLTASDESNADQFHHTNDAQTGGFNNFLTQPSVSSRGGATESSQSLSLSRRSSLLRIPSGKSHSNFHPNLFRHHSQQEDNEKPSPHFQRQQMPALQNHHQNSNCSPFMSRRSVKPAPAKPRDSLTQPPKAQKQRTPRPAAPLFRLTNLINVPSCTDKATVTPSQRGCSSTFDHRQVLLAPLGANNSTQSDSMTPRRTKAMIHTILQSFFSKTFEGIQERELAVHQREERVDGKCKAAEEMLTAKGTEISQILDAKSKETTSQLGAKGKEIQQNLSKRANGLKEQHTSLVELANKATRERELAAKEQEDRVQDLANERTELLRLGAEAQQTFERTNALGESILDSIRNAKDSLAVSLVPVVIDKALPTLVEIATTIIKNHLPGLIETGEYCITAISSVASMERKDSYPAPVKSPKESPHSRPAKRARIKLPEPENSIDNSPPTSTQERAEDSTFSLLRKQQPGDPEQESNNDSSEDSDSAQEENDAFLPWAQQSESTLEEMCRPKVPEKLAESGRKKRGRSVGSRKSKQSDNNHQRRRSKRAKQEVTYNEHKLATKAMPFLPRERINPSTGEKKTSKPETSANCDVGDSSEKYKSKASDPKVYAANPRRSNATDTHDGMRDVNGKFTSMKKAVEQPSATTSSAIGKAKATPPTFNDTRDSSGRCSFTVTFSANKKTAKFTTPKNQSNVAVPEAKITTKSNSRSAKPNVPESITLQVKKKSMGLNLGIFKAKHPLSQSSESDSVDSLPRSQNASTKEGKRGSSGRKIRNYGKQSRRRQTLTDPFAFFSTEVNHGEWKVVC